MSNNKKKVKQNNTNKKSKNIAANKMNNKKVGVSTSTNKTNKTKENKIIEVSDKHVKRLRNLIFATAICSLIIVASTYAWFIGMKTVNVSPFDVSIKTTEGLYLSLNGADWSDTVSINEENYNDTSVVYTGNTNSWGGRGLIPMSTVGKINPTTSRLRFYEKGSFTATPGGYRIMASEIPNTTTKEEDGYVTFDLFIKNLSGTEYYADSVNIKNEEAIYLTPESEVKVAVTDNNEENSGIENSVRVAFAQIGRVKADSASSTITGITCQTTASVLGICEDRIAQIWEPNDTKHVQNAINWYKASCKKRIGADLTQTGSYSGDCNQVVDGVAVPTYVVGGKIVETDRVDTYDAPELNGYSGSKSDTPTDGKLYKFTYFTDTMKDYKGTKRPTFMMLAPNSVTKVRVYIYLEGQDIDNYDFAQLGKRISVAFGFTKERFYGEDVKYNETNPQGPSLPEGLQERATGTI